MQQNDYLNFDILIDRRDDEKYVARVTFSPIESKGTVEFELSEIEIPDLNTSAEEIREYGEQLFKRIFADNVGTSLWLNFQESRRQQRGLRIRLWLDQRVPELALIPWELLYAPGWNRFVTQSSLTPIVRYIDGLQDAASLQVDLPLRILVVISNPQDEETLNAEAEWEKLNEALHDLKSQGIVSLDRLEKPTVSALQKRLVKDDIHILHFIGHGYFDEQANQQKGEGGLLLEDAQGNGSKLNATALATLLHDKQLLRLVFLNTCEGAAGSGIDYFAGTAQKLIQQGIPAVIAMQFPVSDSAAIRLSEFFYQTLASGYPLDTALSEARKAVQIQTDNGLEFEWATPALFSRSPSNQLFTLPTAPVPSDELPFALHDLFDLTSRLQINDASLFALYKQSLPPLTKAQARPNLSSILVDLWNLAEHATYGKPIVSFAKALAKATDDADLQSELTQWIKSQQPQSAIAPPLPPAQKPATGLYDPCLQVELRLDPQSTPGATNKQFLVRIALWQHGEEQNWYDEQHACTLDKIPAILMDVLAKNDSRLPADAAFEFLVPRELFNEDLDAWETSEEYGLICGENYPVFVRSIDRLSSAPSIRAKLFEKWQTKWQSFGKLLEESADGQLKWCSPTPDFKKLGSELEKSVLSGAVGLDAAPGNPDIFKALIIAGIPVALWPKKGTLQKATLQKLIEDHLATQTLSGLPSWLRHLRAHAKEMETSFALLWDDPTRIPQKYRDEGVCT